MKNVFIFFVFLCVACALFAENDQCATEKFIRIDGKLLERQIEDGQGIVHLREKYFYDERGNVIQTEISGKELARGKNTFRSHLKTYSQDQFCNLEKEEHPTHTVVYEYKKGTNLVTAKFVKVNKDIKLRHFYFYDADGVPIKEIYDDGSQANCDFLAHVTERHIKERIKNGPNSEIIEEKYFDMGQKREVLKRRIQNDYDEKGTLLKRQYFDAQGVFLKCDDTRALSEKNEPCAPKENWQYSYDILGRIISTTDPNGNVQRTEYNVKGDPVAVFYPDQTEEHFEWVYFNDVAKLARKKERNNTFSIYEYDYQGRLIRKEHLTRQNSGYLAYERYEYSPFHLQKARNAEGYYTLYTYDAQGRCSSKTQCSVKDSQSIDAQSSRTEYEYDALDQVRCEKRWVDENSWITLKPEQKLALQDNKNDQIEALNFGSGTHLYEYSLAGRLIKVRRKVGGEQPKTLLNFDYDRLGNMVLCLSADGVKTTRSFNHLGLITSEVTEDEYGKYSICFEYDRMGRVKKVILPDTSSLEYSYEGIFPSHIVRKLKSGKEKYRHTLSLDREAIPGVLSFAQSSNYAVEPKIESAKEMQLSFDPFSALSSIETADDRICYKRDATGRLASRRQTGKNSSILRFFYIGADEIGAINEKGQVVELKVPKQCQNGKAEGCVAIELERRTVFPSFDQFGNIAHLTSASKKKILERYNYSATGVETIFDAKGNQIKESLVRNPWRYKAKRTDPVSGYITMGNKEYDPTTGRFLNSPL